MHFLTAGPTLLPFRLSAPHWTQGRHSWGFAGRGMDPVLLSCRCFVSWESSARHLLPWQLPIPTPPRHGASQQTALGPLPPARPAACSVRCAWCRAVGWGRFLTPHGGCRTAGKRAAQALHHSAGPCFGVQWHPPRWSQPRCLCTVLPPNPVFLKTELKQSHCKKRGREGGATKEKRKEWGEKGEEKLGKEICKAPSHCHLALFPSRFFSCAPVVCCSTFFNTVASTV